MLHALSDYGARLGGEPGFKTREVRWRIDITLDGKLLAVIPLGDGNRGAQLARCPDTTHGMNAGGKAHFLVEMAQFIALHLKPNEDPKKVESAQGRHAFYINMIREAGAVLPDLAAIHRCLTDPPAMSQLRAMLAQHRAKSTDWLTWRVGDADPVTLPETQSWWRDWRQVDSRGAAAPDQMRSDRAMVCLLTGDSSAPLPTHPKITGLSSVGGLAMGDVMVGYDKSAFTSFGLDQSANAAMSATAAQQYVDGLNELIRNRSRKIGESLTVSWFKERVAPDEDPFALLYGLETEEQQAASALIQANRLLSSIKSGQRQDLGGNHYYAMTLSGAAGRVMVRDWMEGQFEQLATNVVAWFTDLSIEHRDAKSLAPDPKFLAVCGALVRELKDLPGSTASALWRAAAANQPIPAPIMAQALFRFRVSVLHDEVPHHARIGLIKAYFIRQPNGGDPFMKPYLNPEHPAPAYHCGRLLAVLARLQHSALGDVGAGVVQRFYPAASQTPGLTLGRLIANARNHLAKLDGGLPWWYEERIAEIMGRLGDEVPRTLDLEGQGLFALGYYQQLAHLRSGGKNGNNDEESGAKK